MKLNLVQTLNRPTGAEASERWYVVNTQATREHVAAAHLQRQGYSTYLPSTWRTIRHARRVATVKAGYFPGYLFVSMDLHRDRWRPIEGTVGVLRIIKGADRPLAVPAGLVEMLLDATGPDGVLNLADPVAIPGQIVRVTRGPFADQLAVVERSSGEERVRVLMTVLGATVPVETWRRHLCRTDL